MSYKNCMQYCSDLMVNHVLLVMLFIFIVTFVFINYNILFYENVYGNINGNKLNYSKTVMLSGIFFLLAYLFLLWDNDDENKIIPNYKIKNSRIDRDILSQNNIDVINRVGDLKTNSINDIFLKNRKVGLRF